MITDIQSYGFVIRDTLYAKAVTLPFFTGWKSRRSKQYQIMPEHIPYLGVYFVNESMQPDGDFNSGEVRFINSLSLGFSAIIQNNDPIETEETLDQAYWALMNGLWRDQYIMNLADTSAPAGIVTLPDGIRIEGVKSGSRKHVFGNAGLSNELPIAEMTYMAELQFRSTFPAIIEDDLLLIQTEIVPLRHDGTIPPVDEVRRIIRKYEFAPPFSAAVGGAQGTGSGSGAGAAA